MVTSTSSLGFWEFITRYVKMPSKLSASINSLFLGNGTFRQNRPTSFGITFVLIQYSRSILTIGDSISLKPLSNRTARSKGRYAFPRAMLWLCSNSWVAEVNTLSSISFSIPNTVANVGLYLREVSWNSGSSYGCVDPYKTCISCLYPSSKWNSCETFSSPKVRLR